MGSTISIATPTPGQVIAAGAVLGPLCTIAVALRVSNSRYLDDWLTIPALVLLWGQSICLIYGESRPIFSGFAMSERSSSSSEGTARHAIAYPDPEIPPNADPDTYVSPEGRLESQLLYAILLMQIPCLTLIKLSFVFFYRRVFVSSASRTKRLLIFLNTVAGILVAWAVAFWFAQLFICRDIPLTWNGSDEQQQAGCSNFTPFDLGLASSDFILDLLVFLIPVPLVFKLNLSRRRQFGVLGVFSIGGLAIAASITRFVIFTYEADNSFTIILFWTGVESGIALICSCLPSLFGFYTNVRRKASERSRSHSRSYGSNSGLFAKRRSRGQTRLESINSAAGAANPGNSDIRVTRSFTVDTELMALEDMPPRQDSGRA